MAPNSPSSLLSRRDLLAAGALTIGSAVGMALLSDIQDRSKVQQKQGMAPRPLTGLPLAERLDMNAEERDKLWQMGAQGYMADLRRRSYRLLAESNPYEEKAECVDERQEDGVTNCLAGLGVHIPEQRATIAANMISDALVKYEAQRHRGRDVPITIRLTWHGEGRCGAAALACKQERPGVEHFTEQEIDAKAHSGALLLAREINMQLRVLGKEHACRVVVDRVPASRFVEADGHPSGVILINGDQNLEHNRDGEPLLSYGTSHSVFGQQGIRDAVLSAKISMGGHGFHHVYHRERELEQSLHAPRELRQIDKPIFIAAGPADVTRIIRRDLEAELRSLPDSRDRERLTGRIDEWVTR